MGFRTSNQPSCSWRSWESVRTPHSSSNIEICFFVIGCNHLCLLRQYYMHPRKKKQIQGVKEKKENTDIAAFIAGATKILFFTPPSTSPVVSQALITFVNRLSHIPFVILASVFALNGAMTIIWAHLRRLICKIPAPRVHESVNSSSSW